MVGARRFVPRRDQLVAASLVGAVVVVVGFASGMGIRQQSAGTSTLPARSGSSGYTDTPTAPGVPAAPETAEPGPVVPAFGRAGYAAPLSGEVPAGTQPGAGPVTGTPEVPGEPPTPPANEAPQPPPACQPGLVQATIEAVVATLGVPTGQRLAGAPESTDNVVYQLVRGILGTCPPLVAPD